MGFGFLSMTARAGVALDPPVDVFVHQVSPIPVTWPREWGGGARAQVGGPTRNVRRLLSGGRAPQLRRDVRGAIDAGYQQPPAPSGNPSGSPRVCYLFPLRKGLGAER